MGAVNKEGGKLLELQYSNKVKKLTPKVCHKKWHPGKNPEQKPPSKKEIESYRGFCVRGEKLLVLVMRALQQLQDTSMQNI